MLMQTPVTAPSLPSKPWKILFVDDDRDVLEVSELVFDGFELDDVPVEILTAESGAEAIEMFKANPDVAVAYIDVAMENPHAGLDVVSRVRHELGNDAVRLIIRTGNPGAANPADIVRNLPIDDYRRKTDLTAEQLEISLITSLRTYRRLVQSRKS